MITVGWSETVVTSGSKFPAGQTHIVCGGVDPR